MMMLLKWLVILQFFIREIVISQSLYGQFDKAYDQFDKACAPNWSSKSCMCRGRISSELIPEMKCQNITDSNQFDKAFNYTWGKKPKVIHLSVVNCTTAHISANTFKMLQFVQIHFHNSNLGEIDKLAFLESRNTAVSVSFTNNNFSTNFGLNFLVPLRLLTFVYFDKTNYLSISYESFGDLPVLSDIIIRETKSFKMDKLAFSRLPQLKSIGLMTNGIEKLEKNMFTTSNYTRPVVINLSFNQIREIDPDALIDLYTNDLDLQYNKLTTLKQAAFEPLLEFMLRYQNSKLLTNGNPFDCDLSMQWLAEKPLKVSEQVKDCPCVGEVDCGKPPEVFNGSIIFMTGSAWKDRVVYTCDHYHTAITSEEIECQANKTWSTPAVFCAKPCTIPRLYNGYYVKPTVKNYVKQNKIPIRKLFPHESRVKLICDEGYEIGQAELLFYGSEVTCIEGKWSPWSPCYPSDCNCSDVNYDKLNERNLTVKCSDRIAHHQTIELRCNSELLHLSTKQVPKLKCVYGRWIYPDNPNDICAVEKSCYIQKLKLDNGKIFKHGKEWQFVGSDSVMLKHGSELRFQCVEKGYELFVRNTAVNKDFAVTKCETGRWLGQIPVCKPARCSCAKLQSNLDDNGLEAVTCEDAIASRDLVDLKCVSDDSTPIGLLFAECERGEWGVVNATCIG